MATCKVLVSEALRVYTGGKAKIGGDGGSVAEVFAGVAGEYPELMRHVFSETGRMRNGMTVFLNGADIRFGGGLQAAVKDGDTLNLHAPLLVG
jgi:hypothetical protein